MDKEVKNIQRAEDMTLTLINIDSLNKALDTIRNFCIHWKNLFVEWNRIRVTNGAGKYLGIHIGNEKLECYKKWMNVYHVVEVVLES